ncbi:MAG: DUF2281 domain-containing protein [Stigonema ocellatum SAG 48.90 = DSM 106950]|nr:DUF2281 domain-containing protein [Stigonema ocellatum SAG 48.90 = DSM 106950]
MTTEELAIAALKKLPPNQQLEALNFIEFLQVKASQTKQVVSALEAAGDLVGCLDGGPSDLSTNKRYLEGFGA